jgi:ribosomal protein L11 methylase PrmA
MKDNSQAMRDLGSFRDPSGYVFAKGDEIYRTVNAIAAKDFHAVLRSNVLPAMVERGLMIKTEILDVSGDVRSQYIGARGEVPDFLLRHPKVPFISYAYEWTFGQLKDAALTHLQLQIEAFACDLVLSDASTFNMQFIDGKFRHIDLLSLRPYKEGEPWVGYNQFCRMFLAPLLIEAWAGIPFQNLLRGRIEGIQLNELRAILPKSKLWTSLNALLHVNLQALLISKADSSRRAHSKSGSITLPRNRYLALLKEMYRWIDTLKSGRRTKTYWDSYASENSYSTEMRRIKHEFVEKWANSVRGGVIWDLGGNTGEYTGSALKGGASFAVILDSDIDSLEKAYTLTKSNGSVLPLVMDIADPSPRLGWNQSERSGLNERTRPDGLIALAVIHHMVIGRNIPLSEAICWMVSTSPSGVIEFVPKSDPMIAEMLLDREDVFIDYDEKRFVEILETVATITRQHRFEKNGRLLISYVRKSLT